MNDFAFTRQFSLSFSLIFFCLQTASEISCDLLLQQVALPAGKGNFFLVVVGEFKPRTQMCFNS